MNREELARQGIRFREFRFEDIRTLVDIRNRVYPDTPTTVETEEHFEAVYPKDNPRKRIAVESRDGQLIGFGDCMNPFWMKAPGVYTIWAIVDPDWRRRGIAQALFAELEPLGRGQGATRLWADCREDFDFAIRFLERAGFHNFGLRFESKLDLTTFDEARFPGAIERASRAGFQITTLAAERTATAEADRLLYDLSLTVMRDVPLPGGAIFEQTFEDFRNFFLKTPDADPAGAFIAKHGDRYAGLTVLFLPKHGPAYTALTGTQREYRGQGLALALKLLSIRLLKERGYGEARTNNDTANPSILHLNEKLGYQKLPGWLQWEKPLTQVR